MRFLIDANLPRATRTSLIVLGHEAVDVRDVGLRTATDQVIALYAKQEDLAILTRDRGFANTQTYPPANYSGIIVINLPFDATAKDAIGLVHNFVGRTDLLEQTPGKTMIVSKGKVQVRGGK